MTSQNLHHNHLLEGEEEGGKYCVLRRRMAIYFRVRFVEGLLR